jgi:hypothetical protein
MTNTQKADQRVVCAAIQNQHGWIVCGARHHDQVMNLTIVQGPEKPPHTWTQGFIDQFGNFLTREQAWIIAERNGQIIRRVGGDGTKLFSENIY